MSLQLRMTKKIMAALMTITMLIAMAPELFSAFSLLVQAAPGANGEIANDSLSVKIGDLGQVEVLNIVNNPTNGNGQNVNFVLPNSSHAQNNVNHQWMGEMIFSYRTSANGSFSGDFTEVDTNRTMRQGGSTTYTDAGANLASNPYINKTQVSDTRVEVEYVGLEPGSGVARAMEGFKVDSVYDLGTDDDSMLWEITITNTSDEYIEFGDVGLPMPWNNNYTGLEDTYMNRVTAHTFAGADSGYAYAIRSSGEGNYILFTPVAETGARIEYIEHWQGWNNNVSHYRTGTDFSGWVGDDGWQPGLSVYYIHSTDIREKTGSGYFTDSSSLVLQPGESETYQFKFSAVRAGDNTPQDSAASYNNASDSSLEREANMRSILYNEGLIDAVAVPGFQTAINMKTQLALHYDTDKINITSIEILNVEENDPYDEEHIPNQVSGRVNNSRAGRGTSAANEALGYSKNIQMIGTKTVDGEVYEIYELSFNNTGNNSVRVEYELNGEEKFTQYEFNVMTELDEAVAEHASFILENQFDDDPDSATYGIYEDWYLSSGLRTAVSNPAQWGDDWSHGHVNFMTMKNYLIPNEEEIASIETYLIDFMWESYMKYSNDKYHVANFIDSSGIYTDLGSPYSRPYSEMMVSMGFFNMYRIQKAYPDLMEYRENALYYLEKAHGIYTNRITTDTGFYGEQQVADMIEALYAEGMTEEADELKAQFAGVKGRYMARTQYPYGSEFYYDNTGEEGIYASSKALLTYYPGDAQASKAEGKLTFTDMKTRAMRGVQPTWYHYANPVFIGGEGWWNFQYTASLAGSIMDDYLRYQDNGYGAEERAVANRLNYGGKISNFNAINMGQISADSIGGSSWRYSMFKGGFGAMEVRDGGTRVMNNGWNDFSGESDEGIYGSLLRISADVATDPVFGLTGYGASVAKPGDTYTIVPQDGFGKRINILDEMLYLESEQVEILKAVVKDDGSSAVLTVQNLTGTEHWAQIALSGAGFQSGFYSIKVNDTATGQVYVNSSGEGVAMFIMPADATATVTVEAMGGGSNTAPDAAAKIGAATPRAYLPFNLYSVVLDDGATAGLTYEWEVLSHPEGATVTIDYPHATTTAAKGTVEGAYEFQLTVSDGEYEDTSTLTVVLGEAPEIQPPTINSVDATQGYMNPSVATLTNDTTPDPVYKNTLEHKWEVLSADVSYTLGNADNSTAYLVANQPGTFTLRYTATDANVSSSEEITFSMAGDSVNGTQQALNVITTRGFAPELPETVDVVFDDGTYGAGEVVWDAIASAEYAVEGQFNVAGSISGVGKKVNLTVHVVGTTEINLALDAVPSAIVNSPGDLGGVTMLNNGIDPSSSGDMSNGVWHNWRGDETAPAWVMYEWDDPVLVTSMDMYMFQNDAGNFQPKDLVVTFKDEGGNWYTPRNIEGLGNTLHQYNFTSFEPAYVTAIRIDMKPAALGCGIIEWKVYGYVGDVTVDRSLLRQAINDAENTLEEKVSAASYAELQTALSEAKNVLTGENSTQEDVDDATIALKRAIMNLEPLDGNMAYVAMVTASYTSGWENLWAVNDGHWGDTSAATTDGGGNQVYHWGTWAGGGERAEPSEHVTYTWSYAVRIDELALYIWNDGGGIKTPVYYTYEYLNGDGEWVLLEDNEGNTELEPALDGFLTLALDNPVAAYAVRVTLVKEAANNEGVGLVEWQVFGARMDGAADTTALAEMLDYAKTFTYTGQYTTDSWESLQRYIARATVLLADPSASQGEVDNMVLYLTRAIAALELEAAESLRNIAPVATPDGSANYDGQDGRPNDGGGVAVLNNGYEPSNSQDEGGGFWHNWMDRADDAWVTYTWPAEVIIDSTDVYYFYPGSGNFLPESVSFQYWDADAGLWADVEDAQDLAAEADKYNGYAIDGTRTTALRMTLEPRAQENISDINKAVGLLDWKVYGMYTSELGDYSALAAMIAEAEGKDEEAFTADSWASMQTALATAKGVYTYAYNTQADLDAATLALAAALNALQPVRPVGELEDIAQEATTDANVNYDGQDGRISDGGGHAVVQRTDEPSSSGDHSVGFWHNWLNRAEDAWISYTWDKEVILTGADVYHFRNDNGSFLPESMVFQYWDAGESTWKDVPGATGYGLEVNRYNYTDLNGIRTTALRANLYPRPGAGDPNNGVGMLRWRVYGVYAGETPDPDVDKDDLQAAIDEADALMEEDYTPETWAVFEEALGKAKEVLGDSAATQKEVDKALEDLERAQGLLKEKDPDPEIPLDLTRLKTLVEEIEALNENDFTPESWADLQAALEEAEALLEEAEKPNTTVTQDEINAMVTGLEGALDSLEAPDTEDKVNKTALKALVEQANAKRESDYTPITWNTFANALANAKAVLADEDATQDEVDKQLLLLGAAIDQLKTVSTGKPDPTDPENPDLPGTTERAITFANGKPDAIRVGDTFTLLPPTEDREGEDGWRYDTAYFTATFNSPATFTALQPGVTSITYTTLAGDVYSISITILAAGSGNSGSNTAITSTGDAAGTWVFVTFAFTALALGVLFVIAKRRTRSKSRG